jgi:predicted NUDIX family NTP pyrophosphohydrolase
MPKQSAGVLVYRRRGGKLQVFLIHPGGPYWAKKDLGAWSIPKGEFGDDEAGLAAARREFAEEVGSAIDGQFHALTPRVQRSRKVIHAWAVEGEIDEATFKSNEFELEWPPKSGKIRKYPEADRCSWFSLDEARQRIHPGQSPFLEELTQFLGA